MFRRFLFVFAALIMSLGASAGAWAEERFALVIGNSKYRQITALPNPVRDAKAVSALLDRAGFDVTKALDLGRSEMREAVRGFANRLAAKGDDTVVLVYFAGHGLQIDGRNYLLPVDADIKRESDVPLEAIRLADIVNTLDTLPGKTRIVILDACRNNPFKELGEAARGLAIVNAPAGTVVAYSTSPGATAEDGSGRNSPFTMSLIDAAMEAGAPIETVFQKTRLAVHKATKGRQTPWEVMALTVPFRFFPGTPGKESEAAPEKSEAEWKRELKGRGPEDAYDIVVQQNNVIVYQIFLSLYPDSYRGQSIRALLDRRLEMLAWFDALTVNSVEAFEAFLERYPDSDLAVTAKRLLKRARNRSLLADSNPSPLGVDPKPGVRTVVKEVVRTKTVKVPVEVIKEVRVPVVKEVVRIKTVKVPVIKEVVKVRTVRVPCKCGRPSGRVPIQSMPQMTVPNVRRLR